MSGRFDSARYVLFSKPSLLKKKSTWEALLAKPGTVMRRGTRMSLAQADAMDALNHQRQVRQRGPEYRNYLRPYERGNRHWMWNSGRWYVLSDDRGSMLRGKNFLKERTHDERYGWRKPGEIEKIQKMKAYVQAAKAATAVQNKKWKENSFAMRKARLGSNRSSTSSGSRILAYRP
jgi:hypothetical protein